MYLQLDRSSPDMKCCNQSFCKYSTVVCALWQLSLVTFFHQGGIWSALLKGSSSSTSAHRVHMVQSSEELLRVKAHSGAAMLDPARRCCGFVTVWRGRRWSSKLLSNFSTDSHDDVGSKSKSGGVSARGLARWRGAGDAQTGDAGMHGCVWSVALPAGPGLLLLRRGEGRVPMLCGVRLRRGWPVRWARPRALRRWHALRSRAGGGRGARAHVRVRHSWSRLRKRRPHVPEWVSPQSREPEGRAEPRARCHSHPKRRVRVRWVKEARAPVIPSLTSAVLCLIN